MKGSHLKYSTYDKMLFMSNGDPSNHDEVVSDEKWIQTMKSEMNR